MSADLFNYVGKRLYLTLQERTRFLAAAEQEDRTTRTFCAVLACSGCRISEALAPTPEAIDTAVGNLVFETVTKRCAGVSSPLVAPIGRRWRSGERLNRNRMIAARRYGAH